MPKAAQFTPMLMTADVAKQLKADGYILPASWPFPARVTTDLNAKTGWSVRQMGVGRDEGELIYTAPDGSQFTKATHGARVALVGLSAKTSPLALRVAPGSRRPVWVIQDTPKGEIPAALKAYLLKKGEKLEKGVARKPAKAEVTVAADAEAFAVEPVEPVKTKKAGNVPEGLTAPAPAEAARLVEQYRAEYPDATRWSIQNAYRAKGIWLSWPVLTKLMGGKPQAAPAAARAAAPVLVGAGA